ncbi:hypothetical protein K440DRAFT_636814 [Wilcoxina mikolae CBS 423.85]|nr:hypothetical protein K440DRAFT_636814 [Wilcoxina mikolae CBS 423.85]
MASSGNILYARSPDGNLTPLVDTRTGNYIPATVVSAPDPIVPPAATPPEHVILHFTFASPTTPQILVIPSSLTAAVHLPQAQISVPPTPAAASSATALSEAPSQVPPQVAVQAPAQAPVQAPVQVLFQVPVELPAEVPVQTPVQIPTQAPVQAPVQVPAQVPPQTPAPPPGGNILYALHPDGTITPVHEFDTGLGEYVNIHIAPPA